MARTSSKKNAHDRAGSGSSWPAAVLGLVFLIAAGFAVGMVAGVVWEDPSLVYAYVAGDTEKVSWDGAGAEVVAGVGEVPVDPQVRREAVSTPSGSRPAPRTADPPRKAATSSDVAASAPPTPPVTAAPAGSVAVQVGAFATSDAAEGLAMALRAKGFATYVSPGTKAGNARWRVRVGPLATREEAEVTAARLKKSEQLPTWILNEDAG